MSHSENIMTIYAFRYAITRFSGAISDFNRYCEQYDVLDSMTGTQLKRMVGEIDDRLAELNRRKKDEMNRLAICELSRLKRFIESKRK